MEKSRGVAMDADPHGGMSMERLTGRKENGCAYIVGCPDFEIPKIVGLIIQRVVDKCATIEDILGDEYDLDHLQELVKADREGRVKILAPAMLATCGSCTSFRRTPGTASGICEEREQFKVFQKRPCCKMYEAREDCE